MNGNGGRSRRQIPGWATALALLVAVTVIAACGGGGGKSASTTAPQTKIGGTVSIWAVWSGTEQNDFQQVLNDFQNKTGVSGQFQSKGDQLPTVLGTAISGGAPPDVAVLPQPGLLHDLVAKGALKPIDNLVSGTINSDYSTTWKDLATDGGKLYGVYFKAANKSTVWYNVKTFNDAGVKPPATFDDWTKDNSTLKQFGTAPFAMCGGSGWTLTDWFENVYLRTAGVDKYNALALHNIPWTDPSVTQAFQVLQKIFGDPTNMVGGVPHAVSTPFPDCVSDAFGTNPRAAQLFEADFVATNIPTVNSSLQPQTGYDFFPFPSINGSPSSVSAGGDVAVMLRDTPQAEALIKYLASPDAGAVWAHLGGFTSPNKRVSTSVYPDAVTRKSAEQLITAGDNVVFDMSDRAPAAFGGTAGQGEWADLQNWLRNVNDISGTQAKLEADAKAAYGH
jgi:alpha-glucoside transport system substrate-binding protein